MELETERLVVREWREADVDRYITLANDVGYNCFSTPGYFLVKDAAEAVLRYGFEELKLERIIGFALPQNRASLKILEELGFQYRREIIHAELPHRLYELSR